MAYRVEDLQNSGVQKRSTTDLEIVDSVLTYSYNISRKNLAVLCPRISRSSKYLGIFETGIQKFLQQGHALLSTGDSGKPAVLVTEVNLRERFL